MTSQRPDLSIVGGVHAVGSAERRRVFEAAHPQVTIIPPATPTSRWLAVYPPGSDDDNPMSTMASAWELERLMDDLERIWPPGA
jgi:hypothetical protein